MSGSSPFVGQAGQGDSAIAPPPAVVAASSAGPFVGNPGQGDATPPPSPQIGPTSPGFDASLDQSQVAAQAAAGPGAGTPDNPIVLAPITATYSKGQPSAQQPPAAPIAGTETAPPPPPPAPDDSAQPQGDTLGYLEHLGGLATRAGVEGITGTVTQPLSLAAQGVDYLTGSKALQPIADLPATVDQNLTKAGVSVPQGAGERIATAAMSAIPGALATGGLGSLLANSGTIARVAPQVATLGRALMAAPTTMAASGAASGGASQAATELGAGPVVSTLVGLGAGGLTPHVGSAIADNAARLTGAGQQRLAAQLFLSRANNPGRVVSDLRGPVQQPAPMAPQTTGEATGDLGLLGLEGGLRQDAGTKGKFAAIDSTRADARNQIMQGLQQSGSTEQRGETIRSVLSNDIAPAIKTRVNQLYGEAKPGVSPVVLDPLRNTIIGMLGKEGMLGPGSGGPQGPLRGVMSELAKRHSADGTYLQNMRSRLGNIASVASRAGDNRTASAAGKLRDGIDTLSGSPEWSVAQQARRVQGLALEKDEHGANASGHILKPDKFGVPALEDGKVAARAIRDAASTRQVLRAADTALRMAKASGQDTTQLASRIEQMRTAMRGEFAARLFDHAQTETGALDAHGNAVPNMTAHRFLRSFNQNVDVAKQLFGQEEFHMLHRVAQDFDAEAIAIKARGAGLTNSHTGHNLSTAQFLAGVGLGHIPATSKLGTRARQVIGMLAATGVAAGAVHAGEAVHLGEILPAIVFGHAGVKAVAHKISGIGGHGIRQALIEAASDPNVARALVARVSPRTLNRLADGPHRSRLATIAAASVRTGAPQLTHQQYQPN